MSDADILFSLEELVANTADPVFAVDGNLTLIAWNRAATAVLGFEASEVLGRPCHAVLAGLDDDGGRLCTANCAPLVLGRQKAHCPNYNVCARSKSGRRVWLNVSTIHVRQGPQHEVLIHFLRPIEYHKALEELLRRTVSEGTRRLSAGRIALEPVTQTEPLSRREEQILRFLASGRTTRDVAEVLTISPATVRTHVQRILDKLGVHSRVAAVVYARQHRLL